MQDKTLFPRKIYKIMQKTTSKERMKQDSEEEYTGTIGRIKNQSKPSITNQGQALDGYSALANYNGVAEKINKFLKEYEETKK